MSASFSAAADGRICCVAEARGDAQRNATAMAEHVRGKTTKEPKAGDVCGSFACAGNLPGVSRRQSERSKLLDCALHTSALCSSARPLCSMAPPLCSEQRPLCSIAMAQSGIAVAQCGGASGQSAVAVAQSAIAVAQIGVR